MALLPDFGTWLLRSVRRDNFSDSSPLSVVERLRSLPRPLRDADKDTLVGAVLALGPSLQVALHMLLELLPQDEARGQLGELVCPTLGQLQKSLGDTLSFFEQSSNPHSGGSQQQPHQTPMRSGGGMHRRNTSRSFTDQRHKILLLSVKRPRSQTFHDETPSGRRQSRIHEDQYQHHHSEYDRRESLSPKKTNGHRESELEKFPDLDHPYGGDGDEPLACQDRTHHKAIMDRETLLAKELRAEMRVKAAIEVAVDSLEFAEGQLKIVKAVNRLHGGTVEPITRHFYQGYNRLLARALELERREFSSPHSSPESSPPASPRRLSYAEIPSNQATAPPSPMQQPSSSPQRRQPLHPIQQPRQQQQHQEQQYPPKPQPLSTPSPQKQNAHPLSRPPTAAGGVARPMTPRSITFDTSSSRPGTRQGDRPGTRQGEHPLRRTENDPHALTNGAGHHGHANGTPVKAGAKNSTPVVPSALKMTRRNTLLAEEVARPASTPPTTGFPSSGTSTNGIPRPPQLKRRLSLAEELAMVGEDDSSEEGESEWDGGGGDGGENGTTSEDDDDDDDGANDSDYSSRGLGDHNGSLVESRRSSTSLDDGYDQHQHHQQHSTSMGGAGASKTRIPMRPTVRPAWR